MIQVQVRYVTRHQRRISESRGRIFGGVLRDTAGCRDALADRLGRRSVVLADPLRCPKYTVIPRPLSLVCSMVSVSPRRTVTDSPVWVETPASAASAPVGALPATGLPRPAAALLSVPDDSCVLDGSGSSAADSELIDFQGGLADADRHTLTFLPQVPTPLSSARSSPTMLMRVMASARFRSASRL